MNKKNGKDWTLRNVIPYIHIHTPIHGKLNVQDMQYKVVFCIYSYVLSYKFTIWQRLHLNPLDHKH